MPRVGRCSLIPRGCKRRFGIESVCGARSRLRRSSPPMPARPASPRRPLLAPAGRSFIGLAPAGARRRRPSRRLRGAPPSAGAPLRPPARVGPAGAAGSAGPCLRLRGLLAAGSPRPLRFSGAPPLGGALGRARALRSRACWGALRPPSGCLAGCGRRWIPCRLIAANGQVCHWPTCEGDAAPVSGKGRARVHPAPLAPLPAPLRQFFPGVDKKTTTYCGRVENRTQVRKNWVLTWNVRSVIVRVERRSHRYESDNPPYGVVPERV